MSPDFSDETRYIRNLKITQEIIYNMRRIYVEKVGIPQVYRGGKANWFGSRIPGEQCDEFANNYYQTIKKQ